MNNRTLTFLIIAAGAGLTMWFLSKRDKSKEPETVTQQKDSMEFTEHIPGLKYHIINHGTGDTTPSPGQAVDVHYTGWLDNGGEQGTKFDSSVDRGRPFTFAVGVGHVIKGWDETVLEMREGEKRYIVIDSELGYGAHGHPPTIPQNAKLRFEIELLKIND